MKKVCLINVFFGKYPWYFDFFIKSCKSNPQFQFLLFSDQSEPMKYPKNVTQIKFSLQDFNRLATKKLNLPIDVKVAYKICDFKPAFGVIFEDFIKEYDFWGNTDIDIIFGRIGEFVNDEMLCTYDVISARNDYPTGSFMIYKNEPNINGLFKKSKDYVKVFTSLKHFCFDECNFEHLYLEGGGDIFAIETEIESMHHVLMKEENNGNIRLHYDFLIIEGLPGNMFWDCGVLSFKGKYEVLLYHLILYKDNIFSKKKQKKAIGDQFYIDKYRIHKKSLIARLLFFYDKLRILNFILLTKIERLISIKITSKKKINQKLEGTFHNGNIIINIFKKEERYFLSFFNFDNPKKIFRSVFRKKVYFLEDFSSIYYIFSEKDSFLLEIKKDGSSFKLQKIENK